MAGNRIICGDPGTGNGNTMGVAGKVFDDVGRRIKRILDVDKEICFIEAVKKILVKRELLG